MRKRKVVISGTCHGGMLQRLLELDPSFAAGAQAVFVPNYQTCNKCFETAPVDALLPALEDCDALVYHDIRAYDFPKLLAGLPAGCPAIRIPYITSKLYWPTHDLEPFWLIKRVATAYIPFPCLTLNRLIEDCRDRDAAARAYLRMDITKTVDMDAVIDGQFAYLRRIQAGTIFDFARFTEDNFRTRQLFHLINHPSILYFEMIANRILEELGFRGGVALRPDPFAKHQMPVHPAVIAHYGLTWCDKNTVYSVIDQQWTFEQYVGRYVEAYLERLAATPPEA